MERAGKGDHPSRLADVASRACIAIGQHAAEQDDRKGAPFATQQLHVPGKVPLRHMVHSSPAQPGSASGRSRQLTHWTAAAAGPTGQRLPALWRLPGWQWQGKAALPPPAAAARQARCEEGAGRVSGSSRESSGMLGLVAGCLRSAAGSGEDVARCGGQTHTVEGRQAEQHGRVQRGEQLQAAADVRAVRRGAQKAAPALPGKSQLGLGPSTAGTQDRPLPTCLPQRFAPGTRQSRCGCWPPHRSTVASLWQARQAGRVVHCRKGAWKDIRELRSSFVCKQLQSALAATSDQPLVLTSSGTNLPLRDPGHAEHWPCVTAALHLVVPRGVPARQGSRGTSSGASTWHPKGAG